MNDLGPASLYEGSVSPEVLRLLEDYHTRWDRCAYEDLESRADCLERIASLATTNEIVSETAGRRASYLRALVSVARRRSLSDWVLSIWDRWRPPGALSVVPASMLSEGLYFWDPACRPLAFHKSAREEWTAECRMASSRVPDYFLWLENYVPVSGSGAIARGSTEPCVLSVHFDETTGRATPVEPGVDYLYVVRDGRVCMCPSAHWYHTQLLRGARVQCAGHARFDRDGYLCYVDNRSGHYCPTPTHLQKWLQSLRDACRHSVERLTEVCVVLPGKPYDERRVLTQAAGEIGEFINRN